MANFDEKYINALEAKIKEMEEIESTPLDPAVEQEIKAKLASEISKVSKGEKWAWLERRAIESREQHLTATRNLEKSQSALKALLREIKQSDG